MQTGWVVNLQIALAPLLLFGAKLAILRDAGEQEFLPAEAALGPWAEWSARPEQV
jgi:hypothetical protein